LIPDVSAAALRHNRTRQTALWYILRALNRSGSGFIDRELVVDSLIQRFNYARSTAVHSLRSGDGTFWQTHMVGERERIKIYGLLQVAMYLRTGITDQHFREVPSSEFDTFGKRTAQIYASIHKPTESHSNPLSRAAITAFTGLTKMTQLRYEKVARVHRIQNYGVVKWDDHVQPERVEVEGKNRTYEVNKRLPNSYRTRQQPGSRGMLKKMSRRLRSLLAEEAPTVPERRYFTGARKLVRALERRGEGEHSGYYKLWPGHRLIYGRQEWVTYTVSM
jgi:hypothetical protein